MNNDLYQNSKLTDRHTNNIYLLGINQKYKIFSLPHFNRNCETEKSTWKIEVN